MDTLTIQLTDKVAAVAMSRAHNSGFDSVEEYLSNLILTDVAVPIAADLESELLASLDGPGRVLTEADWASMRHELLSRFGAEKSA